MDNGMECGCSDTYCDYEDGPECFVEENRKARKEHICCECRRIIKKNEEYEYVRGKWEGGFSTFKTCKQCAAIANDYLCGCRIYGNLRDDIWDRLGVDIVTGDVYKWRM